jgi:hypothetical protein
MVLDLFQSKVSRIILDGLLVMDYMGDRMVPFLNAGWLSSSSSEMKCFLANAEDSRHTIRPSAMNCLISFNILMKFVFSKLMIKMRFKY